MGNVQQVECSNGKCNLRPNPIINCKDGKCNLNRLANNYTDHQYIPRLTGLNADEIQEIFRQFSTDERLNRKDMVKLCYNLYPYKSQEHLYFIANHIFDILDTDKNGWITFNDLLTSLGTSTQSQTSVNSNTAAETVTKLDYLFDKYDYNRNGYLDRLELFWLAYDIFGLLGKEQSADKINEFVDKCVTIMDLNQDENISKEAFTKKALTIFELHQVIENPNL